MATPKNKTKKIDSKDLAQLKEFFAGLDELKSKIGDTEIQKAMLLSEYRSVSNQLGEIKKGLEFKYGKVSIDMSTGEIKEIKDEPNSEN